jgi:hypothetical protein
MDVKKILMMIVALAFLAAPAFAGDQPEYDAVGCDSENIFMGAAQLIVCMGNTVGAAPGTRINEYSNFKTGCCLNPYFWPGLGWTCDPLYNPDPQPCEAFASDGEDPAKDICFGECDDATNASGKYESRLGTAFNGHWWKYRIVLQKKPQTDLDINIYDCVVKPNSFTMFGDEFNEGAEQTGRYGGFSNPGSFWLALANPTISVKAIIVGGTDFMMEGRTQPVLAPVCLDGALYTSKGPWDESIVVKMPLTGDVNACGETETRLSSGDVIEVTLATTEDSTADIRYGEDNVMIKYIAIHGTEHMSDEEKCVNCSRPIGCAPIK